MAIATRASVGRHRLIQAVAQPGPAGNSTETIELDVEIHFTISYEGDLGYSRYKATYEHAPKQNRFTLHSIQWRSGKVLKISNNAFEKLADIQTEDGPTDEQLIVYALPGLKAVATGSQR